MKNIILLLSLLCAFTSCNTALENNVGQTTITKFKDGKTAAISITYDDGIINQLTIARPIMNELNLPATFYVITGKVKGSAKGKFIGRPKEEIIAETATIKTNQENFFERASLIAFTGTTEAVNYHSMAGSLFESGKVTEAHALMDEAYAKLRKGQLKNTDDVVFHNNPIDTTTWEDYKSYAAEGHEIASHTVTHARLAVLDEPNLLYELEQSKADIQKFMGDAYTFTAECPYGTENERVMEYAHKIYPALRNRMPESYMAELNRASNLQPGAIDQEYVQWQRGPLTNVSMETMKAWVDTCLAHEKIWLVLVFHGVNGVGWEPRTGEELQEYFSYMKNHEPNIWVATFADVTKYIRERKSTQLKSAFQKGKIEVQISSELDPTVYNVPLTLKTNVPTAWKKVIAYPRNDPDKTQTLNIEHDEDGSYVLYSASIGQGAFVLSESD